MGKSVEGGGEQVEVCTSILPQYNQRQLQHKNSSPSKIKDYSQHKTVHREIQSLLHQYQQLCVIQRRDWLRTCWQDWQIFCPSNKRVYDCIGGGTGIILHHKSVIQSCGSYGQDPSCPKPHRSTFAKKYLVCCGPVPNKLTPLIIVFFFLTIQFSIQWLLWKRRSL